MLKKKRHFTGTSEPKTHYDRKVHHTSTTRLLSLGKIIPRDWLYVRIHLQYKDEEIINLAIEKLLGVEEAAQIAKFNQKHKQNT